MTILIYPVTRSVLAAVYKITRQTFTLWLHDIGITHRRMLSPADLKKIIRIYDLPEDVQIKGL
jgi:hypothetical protein